MSTVLDTAPEQAVRELYTRYTALALSTSASLLLGGELGPIAEQVDALVDDCEAAGARADALGRQTEACGEAAASLRPLLSRDPTPEALAHARETHLRLRRAVWEVIPFEYVPCCASTHDHHERRS